jgi:hypothetical protein
MSMSTQACVIKMQGDDLVVTLRGAACGPELMAAIAMLLEDSE